MRSVIVGLGIQGVKRARVAGASVVATVDPVSPQASYKKIEDVPLAHYDAAYVCTPDDAKNDLLAYLLSHGKHVLVEKPLLTKDPDTLLQLKKLALEQGVVCYTAYNHRFEPHIAALRETIAGGTLGTPYLLRIFYGNGTARDVRNSPWRDRDMGVLSDIGSHLLDIVDFLLGDRKLPFALYQANRFENKAWDHVTFGAKGNDIAVELEATMLSWRNTFQLDLLCEKGSAHIECLCKWGPSTLTLRTRVLPSGRPEETKQVLTQPDPTWELEHNYFLERCKNTHKGAVNNAFLEKDLWISSTLEVMKRGFSNAEAST